MNEDNPPAFPFPEIRSGGFGIRESSDGMSLRDWFAGQAMAEIIGKMPFQEFPADWSPYHKAAIGAYDYANAMLAARKDA